MFNELEKEELQYIDGGCGWCYVGATATVVGGFMAGGPIGGFIAIVASVAILV